MNYLFVLPKSSSRSSGGYNIFPVGITYVTAYLKSKGFNVFTANLEFYSGSTYQALARLIKENEIHVVATGGLSRDYLKVREIVDTVKDIKSDILTVVGGGIISGDPEPAMVALGADIGIIGEGEKTTAELAYALDNGLPFEDIPGLVYRDREGKCYVSSLDSDVIEIDEIPIPDYDGFNYSAHIESVNNSYAYVVASRSCPFKCTFCFHPSGTKYRQRSLDNLFLEIDYLIDKYNIRTIGISDEIFASNKDRVIDFCNRITSYPVTWTVQLRVSDVDNYILERMSASGCICVSYGIESADNSVLKSMKKHITIEQTTEALSLTYANNMEIQGGLIFGDEADTKATVGKSLEWYENHSEYALELNMINIFPGSELYRNACDRGLIKDRVQYLIEGCPLVNVSKLTSREYKDLSSYLYEKNMKVKNPPKVFELKNVKSSNDCIIEMLCNKCGEQISIRSDALHMKKVSCPECHQRHYVDPYERVITKEKNMASRFSDGQEVAIWGAGEVCIKLLERFEVFRDDRFRVVDISKSRQGYSICNKTILSPEIIEKNKIKKVVIAVVSRKEEIVQDIKELFPSVEYLYTPGIEISSEGVVSVLDEDKLASIGVDRPCQA